MNYRKHMKKQHYRTKRYDLCRSKTSRCQNCHTSPRNSKRKTKTSEEIRIEAQMKKFQQEVKVLRKLYTQRQNGMKRPKIIKKLD